jgi:ribosomal protein S18 acetylase RimI-like enzyme
MTLLEKRRSIRHLLDERAAADSQAAYYAFYHPDNKTRLVTYPADTSRARGYLCLSRTGIDLIRPLITLRLPIRAIETEFDYSATAELFKEALPINSNAIISSPSAYQPILSGLLTVQQERKLKVFVLEPNRYQPIINVLVTKARSPNDHSRYIIKSVNDEETNTGSTVFASAGINWQSPNFAEIYVHTKSPHRRQGYGRSVVSALAGEIVKSGRKPIYVVDTNNSASIQLAESVGFVDTGIFWTFMEITAPG